MGKAVGGSPWITILISLILCGACLVGLLEFTQESRPDKLWTPGDSTAQKHKLWVDDNFPTEVRVSVALIVAGDVLTPAILKEVGKDKINLNLFLEMCTLRYDCYLFIYYLFINYLFINYLLIN